MGTPEKAMMEGFSSSAVKKGSRVYPAEYTALGSLILIVGPFRIYTSVRECWMHKFMIDIP
jgi:hypothetical protein